MLVLRLLDNKYQEELLWVILKELLPQKFLHMFKMQIFIPAKIFQAKMFQAKISLS